MKTLLDYVEQYLKEEGLSSAIPDERKRGLFQGCIKFMETALDQWYFSDHNLDDMGFRRLLDGVQFRRRSSVDI